MSLQDTRVVLVLVFYAVLCDHRPESSGPIIGACEDAVLLLPFSDLPASLFDRQYTQTAHVIFMLAGVTEYLPVERVEDGDEPLIAACHHRTYGVALLQGRGAKAVEHAEAAYATANELLVCQPTLHHLLVEVEGPSRLGGA